MTILKMLLAILRISNLRNLCLRKMSQSALSDLAEAATADIEDQGWASIKRAQPIIEQWVSAGVPAPRIYMRGHRLSGRARGGLLKLRWRLIVCAHVWTGGSGNQTGQEHMEAGSVQGRSGAV